MVMKFALILAPGLLSVASCAAPVIQTKEITAIYVADFRSQDIPHCRPSDVDLSHSQAREFFLRARQVDARTLHDHYNYAPCAIEGTLRYRARACEWEIRAGATGHIKCGDRIWTFACDQCDDLFRTKTGP